MVSPSSDLDLILRDESVRRASFPVCQDRIFLAHAGVAPLPRVSADAVAEAADKGTRDMQEAGDFFPTIRRSRESAARVLNVKSEEIALLGPTALGLSLVALGIDWREGDEVIYYTEDYPANVYAWQDLARKGVKLVPLQPTLPGKITPDLVRAALTSRTRLVALASCHFLTGYRLDIAAIGELLRSRQILFSLDAIQSIGGTPVDASAVDFLSADAHKWMLGPVGAGVFYVREEQWNHLRPALLGAWNIVSPGYIAQPEIVFEPGARRYEPGTLNLVGIVGMVASLDLLHTIGIERITARLLHLRRRAIEGFAQAGFAVLHAETDEIEQSGIITVALSNDQASKLTKAYQEAKISVSIRWDRAGAAYLRLSPHFYNTEGEIEQAVRVAAGVS